jgi:hypothetical protein
MRDSGNELSSPMRPAIKSVNPITSPTLGTNPEDTARKQVTYEIMISVTAENAEALAKRIAELKAIAKDLGWTIPPTN